MRYSEVVMSDEQMEAAVALLRQLDLTKCQAEGEFIPVGCALLSPRECELALATLKTLEDALRESHRLDEKRSSLLEKYDVHRRQVQV